MTANWCVNAECVNAECENSLSSYVSSSCTATVGYMLVKDEDHHRLHLTHDSQAQIGAKDLL